jgi:hypothetical protein
MSATVVDGLNETIASQFEEAAELLEAQHSDPFRVRAYRRGADCIRRLDQPVERIYADRGLAGLVDLPGIGFAMARAIADVVELGAWRWLDRLRGDVDPEAVFCTVPGIGPTLARHIHEDLGIDHLEELEVAAHDGRLARLPGFGEARVRAVSESLAGRLAGPRSTRRRSDEEPVVADLLDVDLEYRRRAEADELPRIAPRRFNPGRRRWLPILHTERSGRRYTAMYSNTARAHELGHTRDWVVIYSEGRDDGQWTVVTETSGPLSGERVVRGWETAGRSSPAGRGSACEPRPRPGARPAPRRPSRSGPPDS